MNTDWKAFLTTRGARFDATETTVEHFGDPDTERRVATTRGVLMDLSALGLIAAHGADTRAFLQSQLTNDAKEITPTRAQLSGYCTAKGRLLALFHIHERDDIFYLQLPAELVEPALKRLRMFVLRSKVALEDRSDALARFGFAGEHAEAQLSAALGRAPTAVNEVAVVNGVVVIRGAGPTPRFELIGTPSDLQALWTRLAEHACAVGTGHWWRYEILAGVPQVFKSSIEEFVPQMVNLQAVAGVSFTKGCYPGQEIVARMHYLGTLKRRMYLVRIGVDEPPAPATPLYEASAEAMQSVGNIVYGQRDPDGGVVALAVLVIAATERGSIHLGANTGPELELKELPYALN